MPLEGATTDAGMETMALEITSGASASSAQLHVICCPSFEECPGAWS
jgi:hypothetical protein